MGGGTRIEDRQILEEPNVRQDLERRRADRRRRSSFVLRERRTGFDRRTAPPPTAAHAVLEWAHVHLRKRSRAVFVLLVAANLLSLADYALTLRALEVGATEANPFLRLLFDIDPILTGLVKLVLVVGASLLIWRFRRFRRVLSVELAMVALFAATVAYQAVYLSIL